MRVSTRSVVGGVGLLALSSIVLSLTLRNQDCSPNTAHPDSVPKTVVDWAEGRPVIGEGSIWMVRPQDSWFTREADGSQRVKIGWFRLEPGKLFVTMAHESTAEAQASIEINEAAYGDTGFVSSAISFDTPGCWSIRVRYGDSGFVTALPVPTS